MYRVIENYSKTEQFLEKNAGNDHFGLSLSPSFLHIYNFARRFFKFVREGVSSFVTYDDIESKFQPEGK